jgi:hypothetical protein
MPVIAGFGNSKELMPLVVVENVFARILEDHKPAMEIDRTMEIWSKYYRETDANKAK